MKKIIICIIIISNNITYSQINEIKNQIYVEYDFISNISNKISIRKSNLIANNNSCYFTVFSKNTKENSISYSKEDNIINKKVDISNGKNMFMKNNLLDSTIIYTSNIGKVNYKIKEVSLKFNWVFENKEKLIQNLPCKKATLNFRGRNYIAWYSNEIPVTFGPWKFFGLPGLILEIYDDTNTYSWLATKIVYPYTKEIEEFKLDKYKNITIENYVKLIKMNSQKFKSMLISKAPKGSRISTITIERNSIEKKYEWEK